MNYFHLQYSFKLISTILPQTAGIFNVYFDTVRKYISTNSIDNNLHKSVANKQKIQYNK